MKTEIVTSGLPHSHFAVHHVGMIKACQQVGHLQEGLSVLFHDAVVTGDERAQLVVPQLLETLHLVF